MTKFEKLYKSTEGDVQAEKMPLMAEKVRRSYDAAIGNLAMEIIDLKATGSKLEREIALGDTDAIRNLASVYLDIDSLTKLQEVMTTLRDDFFAESA